MTFENDRQSLPDRPPSRRVLVIGLDGFDPVLARRWMDEGRLPNLARLSGRGVFAPLRSTIPAATLPAWASFATGMRPGRHGLFDFTRMRPGARAVEFVNSTHRRAPAVWRLLSDAGRRVGVLGVPGTYPPEKLNGFQIAGFDSPVATRLERRFAEPPELYDELCRRFGGFYAVAPFQELAIRPGWRRRALPLLLQNLEFKADIALHLLAREKWDFFMALFGESDTVSHHFWMFHDAESPRFDPQGAREFGHAIRLVYERLDRAVGRLLDAAGDETNVFVVSDHGFGGAGDRVLHLNRFLAEKGWLAFRQGGGLMRLARRFGPWFVPQRMQEALFRVRGGAAANWVESRARFGAIDWPHTLAYSEELNYFPSIRLNIEGRDPQGALPAAEVGAFVEKLRAALLEWRNPATGEPVVARVHRREDLYAGPYIEEAPDLILELHLDRGYSYVCLPSPPGGGPATRKLDPGELAGAKNRGMNGAHRDFGVLFAAGPAIRSGAKPEAPTLADLAPTFLAIQRSGGLEAMDGRPLREILTFDAVGLVSSEPYSAQPLSSQPRPSSPAEQDEIRDRLRALGYLE